MTYENDGHDKLDVEQLRIRAQRLSMSSSSPSWTADLLRAAANEIEHLRELTRDGITTAEEATAWEVRDYMGRWMKRARAMVDDHD